MLPWTMILPEWGRYMCDETLFEPVAAQAFREAGLEYGGIKAGYPGSNAVFLCGDYVIKIAGPMFHDDFYRELAALKALSGGLFPRVMKSGLYRDGHDWPWFIMNRIPGEAIRDAATPVRRILPALAAAMKRIWDAGYPEGVTTLAALADTHISHNRALLLESGFTPAFADGLADMPCADYSGAALTHGDITEDHLFVEGDALTGVIDFADAFIAPRAYEYVALYFGALDMDMQMLDTVASLCGDTIDEYFIQNQAALLMRHVSGGYIIRDACKKRGIEPGAARAEDVQGFWERD